MKKNFIIRRKTMKIKLLLLSLVSIIVLMACGEKKEEKKEEEKVFVIDGPSMVYHKNRDCTYISNEFLSSSAQGLDGTEAKYGGKFSPCKACKPSKNSSVVYYTEAGRRYHSSTDCPAMRSSVHEIPLSQAISEGRHSCPRCGS